MPRCCGEIGRRKGLKTPRWQHRPRLESGQQHQAAAGVRARGGFSICSACRALPCAGAAHVLLPAAAAGGSREVFCMDRKRRAPEHIQVRGARVHNLKNIDVDIPLNCITGIAGVIRLGQIISGAGRCVRRGLAAVSGRTLHLHAQAHDAGREGPGGRGAVCSCRAGAAPAARRTRHPQHLRHRNGAFEQPAADVFPAGQPPLPEWALSRPYAGGGCRAGSLSARNAARSFFAPSARGACLQQPGRMPHLRRHGHGAHGGSWPPLCRTSRLTIDEGAVAPWNTLMWSLMTDVCRAMGVRTDVPFRELTEQEKDIVYQRPGCKKAHLLQTPKIPTRPRSWISPISTPSTPWKTPLPR